MLTPREREVLDAIKRYYAQRGQAPRPREIASELGFKSVGGLSKYVTRLESYGYLKRVGLSTHNRRIALAEDEQGSEGVVTEKPLKYIPLDEKKRIFRNLLGFCDI